MTKPSTQCCFKIASIALCLELFQTKIIFNFSFSKLISIGSTEPRCHHKTYRYKRQYNIIFFFYPFWKSISNNNHISLFEKRKVDIFQKYSKRGFFFYAWCTLRANELLKKHMISSIIGDMLKLLYKSRLKTNTAIIFA